MSNHLQCSPCNVTWCSIFPVLLWQHNFFLCFFFNRVCIDFVKWKFYVYILLLSDGGGRFLVSVHPLLLFSHWFWPSLCYPSYISHLIVIMFLFRSQTPFLFHLSDPFTFLVIRTRAPLQESDVPQAQEGATCLGWILAVWLYLFTFHGTSFVWVWNLAMNVGICWNVGQRVHCIHYIFLAFLFSHFPLVSSAFYSFPENIAQLFPNLKPITES